MSYVDESGRGLANQGWKDSSDAVQFRDGRIARAPIALCEVQGYAYQAAMGGAELLDAFGEKGADRWREFAAELAERFRARFWVEDSEGPTRRSHWKTTGPRSTRSARTSATCCGQGS